VSATITNTIDLTFHHLGLATKSLVRAKAVFEALGYAASDTSHVPGQRVNVCFVRKQNHPTIELIEPADGESPVQAILEKVGSTAYHMCYQTPDLKRAVQELRKLKFLPLGGVFISGPLCEQKTCFLYSASVGMVEVTEEK
jgi:methylmalonyl-CoA/ethylmalonyl-CoA epimerase